MKPIKTSAPGKLMLFGDHAAAYDQPCLVMAVNKMMTVELVNNKPRESKFVLAVRQLWEQKYGQAPLGFKISGFSSQYGLGSSAAVTVAAVKALGQYHQVKLSQKQLFEFCYRVIRKVQAVGSGFDLAAAIYGGVVYFVTGGQKIEKLTVKQLPLVVGYSGTKADTTKMIKKASPKINQAFLLESTKIVFQAKMALEQENWQELGKLMNQNQVVLRQLGVSTSRLEKLISVALKAGAYGAKLSGAGGGDCMIALVSRAQRAAVEQAISQAGGEVIKVKLNL
ncbi:hypothetical protein KKH13_02200 [Patescibacteria group bacterium]|nr:hypothetical protein [Patescibacteria group bacterium]